MSYRYTWSWGDERDFINGLGSWSLLLASRALLLRRYLEVLELRDPVPRWYGLARNHAEASLRREERRG